MHKVSALSGMVLKLPRNYHSKSARSHLVIPTHRSVSHWFFAFRHLNRLTVRRSRASVARLLFSNRSALVRYDLDGGGAREFLTVAGVFGVKFFCPRFLEFVRLVNVFNVISGNDLKTMC